MAKENFVLFIGPLIEEPKISEDGKSAKIKIRTIRRNAKYDEPSITLNAKQDILVAQQAKINDYFIIKGIAITTNVEKKTKCPKCGQEIVIRSSPMNVLCISIVNIGSGYELVTFREMSNVVRLLGSLTKDPTLTQTNTAIIAKYPLAVNRKYNSNGQQKIDYPYVNSFDVQAEKDMIHLKSGSQVLIDGGVQVRQIKRDLVCSNKKCNCEFVAKDVSTEIVPFSVEYLNNCHFE